jgi:hypothetical protein
LAAMPLLAIVGLLLVTPGVALGDQAFQTVRAPFYSLDESTYPLKNGFVVAVHMNGPVNFEKKEFQLHGAKPNTEFFIYRVFAEQVGLYAPGTPLPSGFSMVTDDHGNGHVITPQSPTNKTLSQLKALGIDHLTITNVLYDGGTPAYAADPYVTYLDWDWTP